MTYSFKNSFFLSVKCMISLLLITSSSGIFRYFFNSNTLNVVMKFEVAFKTSYRYILTFVVTKQKQNHKNMFKDKNF